MSSPGSSTISPRSGHHKRPSSATSTTSESPTPQTPSPVPDFAEEPGSPGVGFDGIQEGETQEEGVQGEVEGHSQEEGGIQGDIQDEGDIHEKGHGQEERDIQGDLQAEFEEFGDFELHYDLTLILSPNRQSPTTTQKNNDPEPSPRPKSQDSTHILFDIPEGFEIVCDDMWGAFEFPPLDFDFQESLGMENPLIALPGVGLALPMTESVYEGVTNQVPQMALPTVPGMSPPGVGMSLPVIEISDSPVEAPRKKKKKKKQEFEKERAQTHEDEDKVQTRKEQEITHGLPKPLAVPTAPGVPINASPVHSTPYTYNAPPSLNPYAPYNGGHYLPYEYSYAPPQQEPEYGYGPWGGSPQNPAYAYMYGGPWGAVSPALPPVLLPPSPRWPYHYGNGTTSLGAPQLYHQGHGYPTPGYHGYVPERGRGSVHQAYHHEPPPLPPRRDHRPPPLNLAPHNRRAKKQQRYEEECDPSSRYVGLSHPLPPWGPNNNNNNNNKPTFKYTRDGEWESTVTLDADLLEYYVSHVRSQGRELAMWVQHVPARYASRYPNAWSSKCRASNCPATNKTIIKGFWRVAFDEFPSATGRSRDPFHNAGYMHLYCLEAMVDVSTLVPFGFQAEERRMVEWNPMRLNRDFEKVLVTFQDWMNARSTPRRTRARATLQVLRATPHASEASYLWYTLTETHVQQQPPSRSRTRAARDGNSVDKHFGNVKKYYAAEKRLKTARTRLRRRIQNASPDASGDSDSD